MSWWNLPILLLFAACSENAPLRTVSDLDAQRHFGTWHEVAAVPAQFQRQCASDTTAIYAPVADPREIGATNDCMRGDSVVDTALGRARWPISGDYQVMALAPDYRSSLVGHPSRGYAWILAGKPRPDDATLVELRERLREGGYDPCRLILTAHEDPRRGGNPCGLP